MPFRLKIFGIEVECDTVQEMLSTIDAQPNGPSRATTRSRTTGYAGTRPTSASTLSRRMELFKVLKLLDENPDGLHSSEVTRILGLDSPKGIGAKIAEGKKALLDHGLEWDDYVIRKKEKTGMHWYAGDRIKDAIAELEPSDTEPSGA